jgi:hypothetical protein
MKPTRPTVLRVGGAPTRAMDDLKTFRGWCPTCRYEITYTLYGIDDEGNSLYRCWFCDTIVWQESLVWAPKYIILPSQVK